MAPPRITSFLVKVASRCNLDCDYCYVYHHADQSWRAMPKVLSAEHRAAFARRLSDYASEAGLTRCAVVFHGGEPLLAGARTLAEFAHEIRGATNARVDIGLQTNGLLITDGALDVFEQADIAVSLSLDGPRAANDKHRNSRRGRSSFDRVFLALERLRLRPKIFAGIIAVIDASTSPEDLFAFFDEQRPPKLDFLLPDAHHLRPPPGRSADPGLYDRWLIRAFDLWLDRYPHLPVRTFEALLDAASGLPSGTDAFGLGDVSLISIETDGSYHDLDVLKVTSDGATKLVGTVVDTSIGEVAASARIAAHQHLLRKTGLCRQCQDCPAVDICGGGSLPHRYGPDGFDHPTVYCREMLALIGHVRTRLDELLTTSPTPWPAQHLGEDDLHLFELAERAGSLMETLCTSARGTALRDFLAALEAIDPSGDTERAAIETIKALPQPVQSEIAVRPGAVAWSQAVLAQAAGQAVYAVDGGSVRADSSYLAHLVAETATSRGFQVGLDDPWLRAPFGSAIHFEDETVAHRARALVDEALAIIDRWRPALATEMQAACRAIQFVRDPLAHPDKIVSFSDNSVPGALYVSVVQGDGFIDAYDLADSLIHEHRHQKLYLIERLAPMVERTDLRVVSPWREDLRPPSGLLHAIFVFIELRRFWVHVRDDGPRRLHNRAINQLKETDEHLEAAFATLAGCPLTPAGHELASIMKAGWIETLAPAFE